MHEDDFRAIEAGATVVTAGRRLARALTEQFHRRQQARARSVWTTPAILPLDAFLLRSWREWILSGAKPDAPVLLDTPQEQLLWEQVIRESPEGDSLLRIPETAQRAMEAWQLGRAYRLPIDGRFEATTEWSAFTAWSQRFQRRCQANGWLERARLMDVVAEGLAAGEAPRPRMIYRAGFEELTPQQSELFEALGEWHEIETPGCVSTRQSWKFPDATQEIRAAAAWARLRLENAPEAQIGVIVPNLTSLRGKVERIFREALNPGIALDDQERSFHLSLGPPLGEYALIGAAFLMLEFGLGPLALPRAGMLMRSPFLAGEDAERSQRALLDAKLRKDGVWHVTASSLGDAAGHCPLLRRALWRLDKFMQQIPAEQRPSEWARDFSKMLETLGWPGDRSPSSRERQVLEAWRGLLSSLAALDLAAAPMNFAQALARLRGIAGAAPFQVENEGAPVQILGLLEASGLHFDRLWIMGLHDEALPAAASPNPFLPLALQREYGLPHASAEQELEFAKQLLERLLARAPEVVLSYPETEGDRVLAPSPLLQGPWQAADDVRSDDWTARMRASARMEGLEDEIAPPRTADLKQTGGASVFKDMAACPFRAFAKHRLGARPLEESEPGLSYRDRGSTVHKALELIWGEVKSQARLLGLAPAELQALMARNVETAVSQLSGRIGRKLEQRRLQSLLGEWLELEKSRTAFTVLQPEEERVVTVGDVQVRTRVDRIDALAGGGEIILDYKTGPVKSDGWTSDRPDEPQLPLYCATSDRPVTGAAFAMIRAGELGFRGLSRNEAALPGMKKMTGQGSVSFAEQVADWRRVLEQLAHDFSAGAAAVDPKPGACEYCGLTALCRIREFGNERG